MAESVLTRWRKEDKERGAATITPKEAGQPSTLEARIAELERFCE